MTTKDEIKKFIELVNKKAAFDYTIHSECKFPAQRVLCIKHGNGKYVYTTPLVKKEFGSLVNNDKFELLGIFVEGKLYVFDKETSKWLGDQSYYPDSIVRFEEKKQELKDNIMNAIMIPYYQDLTMQGSLTEKEKNRLYKKVRREKAGIGPAIEDSLKSGELFVFTDQNAADMLVDDLSFIHNLKKILKMKGNRYENDRLRCEYIKQLQKDDNLFSEQEMKLLAAIKNVNFSNLYEVTFGYYNEQNDPPCWKEVVTEKMRLRHIQEAVCDKEEIKETAFQSAERGASFLKLLKKLGIPARWEYILRISKNGEIIYKK